MNAIQVTIIGMGPRGLSLLQRMAELAHELPDSAKMDIHLVDPGDSGQGTHSSRQPSHLLTNTVANQLTMFTDGQGPSFTEWAHAAGYRTFSGAHYPTGDGAGEIIGEHDYLPRNLLGEYLSWVFDRTVAALPPQVRVIHHRDRALDIERRGTTRLGVRLQEGFEIDSDFVFLATGHCERIPNADDRAFEEFVKKYSFRNDRLVYCSNPYPVDRIQRIAPGATVAVQGLGLTAHDVIAALTVGRGGRFEGTGKDMRYIPSGREPRIQLFSRQCLPFSARGVNQKGVSGAHKAAFFTREAVERLKERAERERGSRQLDFEQEVLPLLLHEMGYAYRTAKEQRHIPAQEYEFGPEDQEAVGSIIDPLREKGFANFGEFKKFFVDYVVNDLEHAEMGNLVSPVKAATDVIRDTRQSLRDAVESAALMPESHRAFNSRYVPLMNRISFGPPRRRSVELLALLDAGVVDLAGGPGCRVVADESTARFAIESDFGDGAETRYADALVIARLDLFHPESDRSPLTANLLAGGLVRPYTNGAFQPGGLDVDAADHPITAAGTPLPNVWAVGYLVEGPRYYTYALPRPRMNSQFTNDADACVRDMFGQIQRDSQTTGGDHVDPERQPASVS
jgi:FAD-NAD(P)-binding